MAIPDNRSIQADVKRDAALVQKALADAIKSAGDSPAAGTLRGMLKNVHGWAQRGIAAANTRSGTPGPKGWAGWTEAGQVWLAGIEDVAKEGKNYKLDAITATALEVPKTTLVAAKKAADNVAAKVERAADAAVNVATMASSGLSSVLTKAAIAGAVVLAVLVATRR